MSDHDPGTPLDLDPPPPDGKVIPLRRPAMAALLLERARDRYRVVRDEETGAWFAVPTAGGEPVPLDRAVLSVARELEQETGRVPTRDARSTAADFLRSDDAPFEPVLDPPPAELSPEERERMLGELADSAGDLLAEPDLLERLGTELRKGGFVGAADVPKLVFLAVGGTTILHPSVVPRPVSVWISGQSAAGKNFAADSGLAFLPSSLAHLTSGMSPRALIYDQRDLRNRYIYVPEGAALPADSDAALMLRTLISEGRLVYPVVVTREGQTPITELVEREGPTGLVLTLSAVELDRDLETRTLRLHVSDDAGLTRAIVRQTMTAAELGGVERPDRSPWHALYEWHRLAGPHRVRIPFARRIGAAIRQGPTPAVRLRRDGSLIVALISGLAALHRQHRTIDPDGTIVAAPDDYERVQELADGFLSAAAGASIETWALETWDVIPPAGSLEGISYAKLGDLLGIDRDRARDRALRLIERGHVSNLETRPKVTAKLVQADPPAEGGGLLPKYDELPTLEEPEPLEETELEE